MSVQPMCHACHADGASRDGCSEHAHLPGHVYGKPEGTQTARLVAFLRTHPEATSLEITLALDVVNVTGRISDARAQGIEIVCERRSDGRLGYRILDKPEQLDMRLTA